jgi:hypothetical protein
MNDVCQTLSNDYSNSSNGFYLLKVKILMVKILLQFADTDISPFQLFSFLF